jgi:hypothetical protein
MSKINIVEVSYDSPIRRFSEVNVYLDESVVVLEPTSFEVIKITEVEIDLESHIPTVYVPFTLAELYHSGHGGKWLVQEGITSDDKLLARVTNSVYMEKVSDVNGEFFKHEPSGIINDWFKICKDILIENACESSVLFIFEDFCPNCRKTSELHVETVSYRGNERGMQIEKATSVFVCDACGTFSLPNYIVDYESKN